MTMLLLIILSAGLTLPGVQIALTAAVALIGLLLYAFSANAKLAEVGRLSFFAGLLAFLLLVR